MTVDKPDLSRGVLLKSVQRSLIEYPSTVRVLESMEMATANSFSWLSHETKQILEKCIGSKSTMEDNRKKTALTLSLTLLVSAIEASPPKHRKGAVDRIVSIATKSLQVALTTLPQQMRDKIDLVRKAAPEENTVA